MCVRLCACSCNGDNFRCDVRRVKSQNEMGKARKEKGRGMTLGEGGAEGSVALSSIYVRKVLRHDTPSHCLAKRLKAALSCSSRRQRRLSSS